MKKNEEKNIDKSKNKKRNSKVIFYISFCLCAASLGVFVGYGSYALFGNEHSTNYGDLDIDDVAGDYNNILEKYNEVKNSSKDYINNFSIDEISNISFQLFENSFYSKSISIGVAQAGSLVSQAIRASTIRNENMYFEESISKSSFVDVAKRFYKDEKIELFNGKATDVDVGLYDENPILYNDKSFKDEWGKTLGNPCIYIISKQTVMKKYSSNSSGIETGIVKTSTGYDLEIELDPVKSVLNYAKQMKMTSNLSNYPGFYYVHLSLKLDHELNLLSSISKEHYYAKTSFGLGSEIVGTMNTVYKTNIKTDIPKLDTPIDYGYKE